MGPEVCATLAQILPTFLIALAVEGAAYKRRAPASDVPLPALIATYLVMFAIGEVILLLAVVFGWTLHPVATAWVLLCILSSVLITSAMLAIPYYVAALKNQDREQRRRRRRRG